MIAECDTFKIIEGISFKIENKEAIKNELMDIQQFIKSQRETIEKMAQIFGKCKEIDDSRKFIEFQENKFKQYQSKFETTFNSKI